MATKPPIKPERATPVRKPSRAQIKKRLLAEYRAVAATLDDGKALSSPPEVHQQPAELSLDSVAMDLEFRSRESMHERLVVIEDALARLGNGGYGLCQACGQPIEQRRLEVDAATVRCFACQSSTERMRRSATM